MASISHDKKTGLRTIQVVCPDGKRRPIRLGKVSKRQAEAIKIRVEDLVAATFTGHVPSDDTTRWVAGLNDGLRQKLAKIGLIDARERVTLQAFIDDYMARRADIKASTRIVFSHSQRNLIEYFGPDRPLRDISPGDADEWHAYLIEQGLATNTIRRRCGIAKQFFAAAVRKRLISENPFAELKAAILAKTDRFYFVTRETAHRVLDACPDAQWRLIFALCRYGGLRCPSEVLAMRWSDVDWEHHRFTVRSQKTEHHSGGDSRQVPLFPELRPHFLEAFDLAEPGTDYMVTRYRDPGANLRTQMTKIIQRAGLQPWPKLFHNLRSTRETELAEDNPMHVVCKWIGNSQPVAAKHYLQVTDYHFQKAVQNPVQQAHVWGRRASQGKSDQLTESNVCRGMRNDTAPCENREPPSVGDTGLEPVTLRV
ncbi:MAG: tyrosine-type recombinase/integrase [Planctomycetota bacterium]